MTRWDILIVHLRLCSLWLWICALLKYIFSMLYWTYFSPLLPLVLCTSLGNLTRLLGDTEISALGLSTEYLRQVRRKSLTSLIVLTLTANCAISSGYFLLPVHDTWNPTMDPFFTTGLSTRYLLTSPIGNTDTFLVLRIWKKLQFFHWKQITPTRRTCPTSSPHPPNFHEMMNQDKNSASHRAYYPHPL